MGIKMFFCGKTVGIPARKKCKTAQKGYVLNPDNMHFSQVEKPIEKNSQ